MLGGEHVTEPDFHVDFAVDERLDVQPSLTGGVDGRRGDRQVARVLRRLDIADSRDTVRVPSKGLAERQRLDDLVLGRPVTTRGHADSLSVRRRPHNVPRTENAMRRASAVQRHACGASWAADEPCGRLQDGARKKRHSCSEEKRIVSTQ